MTHDPRDVEIARRASGSACPDSNFDPDTPTYRYAIEAARLSREAAEARTTKEQTMTEDQIKHMVGRFLGWRLPDDFYPDGGISFKAEFNENTPWPMRHEPTGTNLFDARQAEAMVRHMLEGWTPPEPVDPDLLAVREIVATHFAWERGQHNRASDVRSGAMDDLDEVRAALAAYKAGREKERGHG